MTFNSVTDARIINKGLRNWLRCWLTGEPHFVIGQDYMHRRYVLPRNRFLNIYLHKFLHDDEDRAKHDHPWWFISVILKGTYREVIVGPPDPYRIDFTTPARRWLSVVFRPAEYLHRVVLNKHPDGSPIPCWTLVITGPVTRQWGFACPKGWVLWKDFLIPDDYGKTGRGCGEHE